MLKRLAARGKQPPGPVSPVVTQTMDKFDLAQPSGESTSPVSPGSVFPVTVYTLDDEQKPLEINVQKDSDGQWLFEEACEQLGGVQEKDYFGLRYLDRDKQRQWVDTTRNIYRQLKHMHPCCVSFRVKHYPPSPMEDLKQEISRYFLFMQIKRDILHSRLLCQGSEAYELAAYIAQIDLGDQEDMEDPETYLNDYKILPNQSPKSETKITEIHKSLKGLVPSEAEARFLTLAAKMETYGVDPYSVRDQKGNVLYLGLTHVGVVTFQGSRRAHIFKWSDITKFNYDGRLFIIHVTFREDNQFKRKKKHILGFKCESQPAALSLWRWAVDRYCFFTLKRSSEAKRSKSGGGIFRRSNTFRFSGRCQREALSNSLSLLTLPQPTFTRCQSTRRPMYGSEGNLTRNRPQSLPARQVFERCSSDRDLDDQTERWASSFRREERMRPLTIETDRCATFPRTRREDEADHILAPVSTESAMSQDVGAMARIIEPPEMEVVEERDEEAEMEPISPVTPHPPQRISETVTLQLRKERPLIGKIRREERVEEWEEEEIVIERRSVVKSVIDGLPDEMAGKLPTPEEAKPVDGEEVRQSVLESVTNEANVLEPDVAVRHEVVEEIANGESKDDSQGLTVESTSEEAEDELGTETETEEGETEIEVETGDLGIAVTTVGVPNENGDGISGSLGTDDDGDEVSVEEEVREVRVRGQHYAPVMRVNEEVFEMKRPNVSVTDNRKRMLVSQVEDEPQDREDADETTVTTIVGKFTLGQSRMNGTYHRTMVTSQRTWADGEHSADDDSDTDRDHLIKEILDTMRQRQTKGEIKIDASESGSAEEEGEVEEHAGQMWFKLDNSRGDEGTAGSEVASGGMDEEEMGPVEEVKAALAATRDGPEESTEKNADSPENQEEMPLSSGRRHVDSNHSSVKISFSNIRGLRSNFDELSLSEVDSENCILDGEVVETLIVPTLDDNQHSVPDFRSGRERGVDVGDGPQPFERPVVEIVDVPDKGGPPPEEVVEEETVLVKAAPTFTNHVPPKVEVAKPRGGIWKVFLSSVILSLLITFGVLVLLFEIGPETEAVRPLTENSVFAGWRQQWYLPLRNKFLPSKH